MVTCETRIEIARSPSQVFAFLCDWSAYPRWLRHCVMLQQTSPGLPAAGATLRYHYSEAGREGVMEGRVAEMTPDARLVLAFDDPAMGVEITLALAGHGAGTVLTETLRAEPRAWAMKLAQGMIRAATQKQIEQDVATLRQVLEGAAA